MRAHGTAVGLPSDADMGNSEVGHNALGSGQVVDQVSSPSSVAVWHPAVRSFKAISEGAAGHGKLDREQPSADCTMSYVCCLKLQHVLYICQLRRCCCCHLPACVPGVPRSVSVPALQVVAVQWCHHT